MPPRWQNKFERFKIKGNPDKILVPFRFLTYVAALNTKKPMKEIEFVNFIKYFFPQAVHGIKQSWRHAIKQQLAINFQKVGGDQYTEPSYEPKDDKDVKKYIKECVKMFPRAELYGLRDINEFPALIAGEKGPQPKNYHWCPKRIQYPTQTVDEFLRGSVFNPFCTSQERLERIVRLQQNSFMTLPIRVPRFDNLQETLRDYPREKFRPLPVPRPKPEPLDRSATPPPTLMSIHEMYPRESSPGLLVEPGKGISVRQNTIAGNPPDFNGRRGSESEKQTVSPAPVKTSKILMPVKTIPVVITKDTPPKRAQKRKSRSKRTVDEEAQQKAAKLALKDQLQQLASSDPLVTLANVANVVAALDRTETTVKEEPVGDPKRARTVRSLPPIPRPPVTVKLEPVPRVVRRQRTPPPALRKQIRFSTALEARMRKEKHAILANPPFPSKWSKPDPLFDASTKKIDVFSFAVIYESGTAYVHKVKNQTDRHEFKLPALASSYMVADVDTKIATATKISLCFIEDPYSVDPLVLTTSDFMWLEGSSYVRIDMFVKKGLGTILPRMTYRIPPDRMSEMDYCLVGLNKNTGGIVFHPRSTFLSLQEGDTLYGVKYNRFTCVPVSIAKLFPSSVIHSRDDFPVQIIVARE